MNGRFSEPRDFVCLSWTDGQNVERVMIMTMPARTPKYNTSPYLCYMSASRDRS